MQSRSQKLRACAVCDVDFSYDSEEKVLDGFSLDIPPGSKVGSWVQPDLARAQSEH